MNTYEQKLSALRKIIDETDNKIIKLLAYRQKIVKEIGQLKKKYKMPVFQPQRWHKVIEDRKKLAQKYGLSTQLIVDIWNRIHKNSLEIER